MEKKHVSSLRHKKVLLFICLLISILGLVFWEWRQEDLRQTFQASQAAIEDKLTQPEQLIAHEGLTVQGGSIKLPKQSLDGQAILDGTITGAQLAPASVTAASLSADLLASLGQTNADAAPAAPQPVTAGLIVDGTITEADIATGSLSSSALNDNAITSDKIADGSVTAADIAPGVLTIGVIPDDSITSAKLVDGTITGTDLGSNSIDSSKIADDSITTADLAIGAITGLEVANSTITTSDIANSTINSALIQDGSVASSDITNASITTSDIANNSITSGLIVDGTVTGSDIAGSSITAADLAASAVTSVAILDGSITGADLTTGAISSVHLADGAVQTSKLSPAAKKRTIAVQVGDITGGKNEKSLFVPSTNGKITKITITNSANYSAVPGKGTLSVERKTATAATVGSVNLSTTNLAAFMPHTLTLSGGTEFRAGDVYSFKADITGAGSSLSDLLTTIEYEVTE